VKAEWWKTIDGVTIVDGLRVWDYDLRRTTVDVKGTSWASEDSEFHKYWEGWFEMKTTDGVRTSSMNGVRMWVRHPTTGEKA
jgi:hypothetical protein